MKSKVVFAAVAVFLLFAVPSVVLQAHAVAAAGLYAAFWKGTFFGASMAAWPGCTPESSPPAGIPSSTPPTATEIDPNVAHGASTGFYWDETPPGFYVNGVQFYDTAFSTEWTGYIYLTAGDTYFRLTSDDGSWLYINTSPGSSTISGANLIINDGPPTTTSGPVSVSTSGWYPIEVDYYETCDSQSGIDLSWSTSASGTFTIIPDTAFMPAQIGSNAPIATSVPQFPFGVALLMAAVFPVLLLMRKRLSSV